LANVSKDMTGEDTIEVEVEVVFALAERQMLVSVALAAGATARDAVNASGIAREFPDQELSACRLGIWGRLIEGDQVLQDGDRIEIYRPLTVDPREARRRLAAEGKFMGGADNDAGQD